MMSTERRDAMQFTDIFRQLNGIVSPGIMNRVGTLGGEIPDRGPGKYSIPNAIKAANELTVAEKTLAGRRQHNNSLFRRT